MILSSRRPRPWLAAIGVLALLLAGAQGAQPAAANDPDASLTAPEPQRLPDKAYLTFEELPEIEKPKQAPGEDKLHPQAARAFEQGVKLLGDQDYLGAVNKLQRASDFNPKSPRVHRALAMAYERIPNYAKAFEHIEKAVELAGDDLEAQVLYGTIALRRKQYDTAVKAFRSALLTTEAKPAQPRAAFALFHLARALEKQGYYRAASDCYSRLSKWVGEHGDEYSSLKALEKVVLRPELLWVSQGLIQLRLDQPEKAAQLLARAYQRDRSNRPVAVSLLSAYTRSRQYDKAEKHLLSMLEEPALQEAAAKLADQLVAKAGEPDMIMRIWKRARDNEATTGQLALSLAKTARELDAETDITQLLEQAIELHPNQGELGRELATAYARAGNHLAALERFARMVAENPQTDRNVRRAIAEVAKTNPEGDLLGRAATRAGELADKRRGAMFYVTARLAQEMGKDDRAAELFAQAVQADSGLLPAYQAVVDIYSRKGQFAKAEALLEKVGDEADGFLPLLLRGKLRLYQKDADAAVKLLTRAHQADRQHVETQILLAKAYVRTGKDYEASRMFLSAANQAPGDPNVYEPMIRHFMRRRLFDEALSAASRLKKRAENSPLALSLLAEAAYADNQPELAQSAIDELARLDPDNPALKVLQLKKSRSEQPGMLDKQTWDKFVNRLNQVNFQDENNLEAREMLAQLFAGHARYELAAMVYGELVDGTWARPDIVLEQAVNYLRAEKPAQAAEALKILLANDSEGYTAKRLYVDALVRREQYDQAAQKLRQWLASADSDPLAVWYRWRLIDVLEQGKDYDAAIEAVESWIEKDSSDIAAKQSERIRLLVKAGKIDQAVKAVEGWEKNFQGDQSRDGLGPDQQILVRRLLVFSLVDAGETRRALKLLDDWIGEKTDPSVESLRSLRIIVLGEAEKATRASNVALEWIRKAPTAMAPRQALISVLHEQEKLDEALTMIRQWQKDLREIAEQDPARKDVAQVTLDWLGQAALLNRIEAQDWDKGLEIANELLADQPDSADVLQFKATCLGELGRRDDQIRILKEIQSANPDDPGINNNLGYFYADAGENLSEAEQLIRKSLRREPSSIAAQDSLGWVFYKQGRFSLAGEVFLRLVERGRDQLRELEPEQSSPVHPIIFDHAGDAFFRLGWPNLAREAWDLALEAARVETQESADLEYVKSKTPGKIEALDTGDQPELAPYDETYLEKNPQENDGDVPDPAIPLPGI